MLTSPRSLPLTWISTAPRREPSSGPPTGINLQARDAFGFWRGLVRYLKGFLEELVRLHLSRARIPLKKVPVLSEPSIERLTIKWLAPTAEGSKPGRRHLADVKLLGCVRAVRTPPRSPRGGVLRSEEHGDRTNSRRLRWASS